MSDQATAGSETEESAQVPSDHQGTQYDDKTLVKQLLEACSNNKEEYNFEDYVVETGRGLEDILVHPKTRQKCYINKEEALQGFVGKTRYRGKRTATPHNLHVFESMMRGPHAVAAGKHSSSCYRDYKWFYATGETAAYTTAKHHAINSLERRIREKISEQWEMLMVLPHTGSAEHCCVPSA